MGLVVTLLAGAFFLVGAVVAWRARGQGALEDYSVAIAFGSLACVAALDLGPEALEATGEIGWVAVAVLVLAGAAALVALERMAPDGHHAEDGEGGAAHIGVMAVLAVSVHNIAEGAAIYAIASQDLQSGAMLALGVGMHNAPMGMLLYSAMERGRAWGVGVMAAASLSTFVGGLIMFFLGGAIDETVMAGVVCVALGMIVYLLFVELLPAMIRRRNPVRSIVGIAIGAAFVLVGSCIE